MANETELDVTVAYTTPSEQFVVGVRVSKGSTIGEAIVRSGILARFPEISLTKSAVGIFGAVVSIDQLVSDGDRVEIYRPLIADPKEARRRRGQKPR